MKDRCCFSDERDAAMSSASNRSFRPRYLACIGRTMRVIGRQSALLVGAMAIVLSTASHAQDAPAFSARELESKLEYCKTCHGLSGQGFRGAFPIPRLAGQQTEYFENQLRAFVDRRRENKFMFSVAHVLSPAMITALATHFRDLNPKPLGGASRELVTAGKKIFDEGVPAADIPPCASCHMPDAKGNGVFPRLAGQLHEYMFNKLVNWSKERGQDPKNPDTSAIMEPIAHSLNESQLKAVAAYLSYLE
jgi:cytochrome c553